ncbi:hypothetical protein ES707_02476 [subsurface metagenome]
MRGQPKRREIFNRCREVRPECLVGRRMGRRKRGELDHAIDVAEHRRGEPAEQPLGTGCDGIEDGLHIRWRTGDNPQYLGRRGLPLQRLARFVE